MTYTKPFVTLCLSVLLESAVACVLDMAESLAFFLNISITPAISRRMT